VHGADDRAPAEHDHGLEQGDGAGPRTARRIRAARSSSSGQGERLLRHGQGRRPRQLIRTPTDIAVLLQMSTQLLFLIFLYVAQRILSDVVHVHSDEILNKIVKSAHFS
jgi:hypothetical protein